jgi:glycosyltransferase involved in cell wall biosynthesis
MASSPRVVIVVENCPVPRDRRVWNESLTLRDAGYDVHVIAPVGADRTAHDEVLEGVTIHRHRVPQNAGSPLAYLREYAVALAGEMVLAMRVWRSGKFDLIHVCNPPDILFLVALTFRYRYGLAVVFDHHDLVPELLDVKFGRRPWLRELALALERATFAVSDVVIAVNESYRAVAVGRGGRRPSDVFVVRNGPDLTTLPALESLSVAGDGRRVGYVGEIGTQDGLDVLLSVANEIVHVRGHEDVEFVIVGDGPDLQRIRGLSSALDLDDCVHFTGYLAGEELWHTLGSCDVCVCPDPKTEYNDSSTMIKTMEYMALAKPIVQFDLREGRASAGEAALYARPGSIIDYADKVLELLNDRKRARDMGLAGRKRVEEGLSWNRQAPTLLEAYEHALAIRRRRS